jgi:GGDEF domain-containing protein
LLHAREHFQSMLERERSRADRAQGIFSLLAIAFKERRVSKEATLRTVNRVLRERLRATDMTGYMADGRIGVLLPDTEVNGAQQLADAIVESFDEEGIVVGIDIFTYPSDSLPLSMESNEDDADGDDGSIEPLYSKALSLWKRCLDVLGSSIGLVLLSPLFLLTALAIKLTSRGPIFFTQLRSGLGGEPFQVYKFQTMCTGAEAQKLALAKQLELADESNRELIYGHFVDQGESASLTARRRIVSIAIEHYASEEAEAVRSCIEKVLANVGRVSRRQESSSSKLTPKRSRMARSHAPHRQLASEHVADTGNHFGCETVTTRKSHTLVCVGPVLISAPSRSKK